MDVRFLYLFYGEGFLPIVNDTFVEIIFTFWIFNYVGETSGVQEHGEDPSCLIFLAS